MSVTGEIKNLYSDKDKTKILLPRTKTKAVSDENGTSLDALLDNINVTIKKAAPVNLLDNSDFRNPVNQRGQTSYPENGYTIDRWVGQLGGVTLSDKGITIGGGYFGQLMERKRLKANAKYTIGFMFNTGLAFGVVDMSQLTTGTTETIAYSDVGQVLVSAESDELLRVYAGFYTTVTMLYAFMYEGEYTAETLPEYRPKGYGAELAECQRYYYRIDNNNEPCWLIAVDSSFAVGAINFPVTMRLAPSLTILKCLDLNLNEVSIYNTVHTRKGISYLYGSFQVGAGYRLLFEASADL